MLHFGIFILFVKPGLCTFLQNFHIHIVIDEIRAHDLWIVNLVYYSLDRTFALMLVKLTCTVNLPICNKESQLVKDVREKYLNKCSISFTATMSLLRNKILSICHLLPWMNFRWWWAIKDKWSVCKAERGGLKVSAWLQVPLGQAKWY